MLPQERQEEMRMLHEEAMLKMELFGRHAGSADWPSTLVVDFAKKFEQRKTSVELVVWVLFFCRRKHTLKGAAVNLCRRSRLLYWVRCGVVLKFG